MYLMSTEFNKSYMKRILCIFSTTPCDQVGLNDNILTLVIAQRGQLNQLLSADFQLRIPTLSQWLGSFPTESRAEIFPQYRQDCPLPPPINRGGFNGQKKEKIGSKVSQKTCFPADFCTFTISFSLHRDLQPPPPSSPVFPPFSPATCNHLQPPASPLHVVLHAPSAR